MINSKVGVTGWGEGEVGSRGNRGLFLGCKAEARPHDGNLMKKRCLPFLSISACLSSAVARSPFPLPVPTRPTSFPLPVPTLPALDGYVITSNGLQVTLSGKVQGGVRLPKSVRSNLTVISRSFPADDFGWMQWL